MARFLVSGCYVMGTTEECVQVFESLYHMDIHQCGYVASDLCFKDLLFSTTSNGSISQT